MKYTLSFPAPETHYAEVRAEVPATGRAAVTLMMPVWTPGSYMVREYARHIDRLSASTAAGDELRAEKIRKNRWRIETKGEERIVVHYRLYCREMSVRTNWVERDFAVLNGAPTFLALLDDDAPAAVAYDISLQLPKSWPLSHAPLPNIGGDKNRYRARDFDEVVDSPILAGDLAVYDFKLKGKTHYLVDLGEGGVWDGKRAAKDVKKIVDEHIRFWAEAPYEDYSFLNVISEAGGGLEHKASTMLMTSRWSTRTEKSYRDWLRLASHEFFHVWNVKRMRPAALGPFDYEHEAYTEDLWFAEGATRYYESLLLFRAGLIDRDHLLAELSETIEAQQTRPGRKTQSVAESSYDAWIKLYRGNENSANSTISYYTKGGVVSFLLDARIRRASDGNNCLDDVMREAYRRYSGERGYTGEELRALISEVAGADLSDWLRLALDSVEELDYSEALNWYGLRFKPSESAAEDGGETENGWLGAKTRIDDGRLVVAQAPRETPAHTAGVNVGDEILAIDDYRVPPDGLETRLEKYRPDEEVSMLVARRDRLVRLDVKLGREPLKSWTLEVDPDAGKEQRKRLKSWLEGG